MWIDVSFRHDAAGNGSEVATSAKRDGEAARRGECGKHATCPGDRLVPFVVETGGRVGSEACQWLRSQIEQLPEDIQHLERIRVYKVVSCAIQGQIARQRRKAAGLQ